MKYILAYKDKNTNSITRIEKYAYTNIINLVNFTTNYTKNELIELLLNNNEIPHNDVELVYVAKKNKKDESNTILSNAIFSNYSYLLDSNNLYEKLLDCIETEEGRKFFFAAQIRNSKYAKKFSNYIKDLYYSRNNLEGFLLGFTSPYYSDKLKELIGKFVNTNKFQNYDKKIIMYQIINELINDPFNLMVAYQNDFSFLIESPIQKEIDYYQRIFNEQDRELLFTAKVSRYLSSVIYQYKYGQYVVKNDKKVINSRAYFNLMNTIIKYDAYILDLYNKLASEEIVEEENKSDMLKFVNDEDDEFLEASDFERIGEDPEEEGYTRRKIN